MLQLRSVFFYILTNIFAVGSATRNTAAISPSGNVLTCSKYVSSLKNSNRNTEYNKKSNTQIGDNISPGHKSCFEDCSPKSWDEILT
jgi:hypothetical protein